MIRWLRSLFAWNEVRDSGVWSYQENAVTGRRRAIRLCRAYQPLNFEWLRAGAGTAVTIDITRVDIVRNV